MLLLPKTSVIYSILGVRVIQFFQAGTADTVYTMSSEREIMMLFTPMGRNIKTGNWFIMLWLSGVYL